jgi:hypothetical protein
MRGKMGEKFMMAFIGVQFLSDFDFGFEMRREGEGI